MRGIGHFDGHRNADADASAGLPVVEASSMPSIVSGNTNAAVLMLAARVADQIIADCR
jgi:choline dehydrogenase-like flavoprotein